MLIILHTICGNSSKTNEPKDTKILGNECRSFKNNYNSLVSVIMLSFSDKKPTYLAFLIVPCSLIKCGVTETAVGTVSSLNT